MPMKGIERMKIYVHRKSQKLAILTDDSPIINREGKDVNGYLESWEITSPEELYQVCKNIEKIERPLCVGIETGEKYTLRKARNDFKYFSELK